MIRENFYKYLCRITTLEEFEKWVFNDNTLEKKLGKNDYMRLISFDFNSRGIRYLIEDYIKDKFDWNEYMEFCQFVEEKETDQIKQQIISIDLNEIKTIEELHKILKIKLRFPDFYGDNWNALWDAITGLVAMPKILEFNNWDSFAERLRSDSAIFKKIIDDFNNLNYIDGKIEIKTAANN